MPLDLCTPCFITSKVLHSFLLVSPFSLSATAQIQLSLTLPGAHFISPLSLPYPYSVSPTKLLAVKVACYASLWPLVPYTGLTMSKQMNTWAIPYSLTVEDTSAAHTIEAFSQGPLTLLEILPLPPHRVSFLTTGSLLPLPSLPPPPPISLFLDPLPLLYFFHLLSWYLRGSGS